jgi:hypothetical protein
MADYQEIIKEQLVKAEDRLELELKEIVSKRRKIEKEK